MCQHSNYYYFNIKVRFIFDWVLRTVKKTNFTILMIKRKALSNILDNIYLCRNIWLQIKYKPNKQYNEISVCNSTTVHRNTAYDTVENNAACLECGEFNQASLYESIKDQD